MPNQMSNQYQSGLIHQLFFNQPMTSPTGWFLALTGPPPTNSTFTELSVSNYARVPCGTSNGTGTLNWTDLHPNSGAVYNLQQLNFAVAGAYWGWVSGAVLCDSPSAGVGHNQVAFYTTISPAKEINQNDQFYVPVSGMLVRLS